MPQLANRLAPGVLRGMLVMLVIGLPAWARQAGVCKHDAGFYDQQDYTVEKIIIETPLSGHLPFGFLFGLETRLQPYLDAIKAGLPLKEGQPFSNVAYGISTLNLAQLYGSIQSGDRFRMAYAAPALFACDEGAKTLQVRYRVYSSDYVSFLSRTFESQPEKITRTLLPQAMAERSKFLPAPFVGYNRSRGIFGGTRLSLATPWGMLKKAEAVVSGSSSSATVQLGLIGDHKPKTGAINHLEWRLGYRYFDLPADTVRHKSGALLAQMFASTKPLGRPQLVLRFGGALEGGHLQTVLSEPAAVSRELLQTRFGALKLYVGSTMKFARQSLKASYGLQLGQAGKEVRVDYVKQVFDSAYSVRFLPRDHLPLQLDTQFSAGLITSATGRIPIAERFYGGNTRRNFLEGSDWQINSDVFMRSFPQNRLNRIGLLGPLGGKNFVALNLTASQVVWHRTLVPKELLQNPTLYADLKIQLRGQLETQRSGLELNLLTETDDFPSLAQDIGKIGEHLTAIKAALNTPGMLALTEDAADLRSAADDLISGEDGALASVKTFHDSKNKDLTPIISLVKDFDADTPAAVGDCINAVNDLLPQLTAPELAEPKARLKKLADDLLAIKTAAANKYQKIRALLDIKPEHLQPAQQHLPEILQRLKNIESQLTCNTLAPPDEPMSAAQIRVRLACAFVTEALNSVTRAGTREPTDARQGLSLLAEGFDVALARLAGVTKSVNELPAVGSEEQRKAIAADVARLTELQQAIKQTLAKIPYSSLQRQAADAVDYSGHVFDVIFREMNLVAISPVVMFDVARLGPQTVPTYRGLRYGIGGGVKFSLVTFDITAAYSWNVHRRPGEGRGALVFSMDVTDLFR